ncbi:hypothetical protein PHLGIDRAFT_125240 [Phlebiopsis gigantea 11061_1 CR5-6]|uniref:Hydrophobin n=1 Tax=Phlebiopsis gigantea (strain 11061_1 CR5-6) TaxID=745531 RepID=A0A0C3PTN8_PHLG1|nr:hypothetical protein PHLGIDRAFT_125240 [Phlebiopsis gigantea 11061_1 CR5-6]
MFVKLNTSVALIGMFSLAKLAVATPIVARDTCATPLQTCQVLVPGLQAIPLIGGLASVLDAVPGLSDLVSSNLIGLGCTTASAGASNAVCCAMSLDVLELACTAASGSTGILPTGILPSGLLPTGLLPTGLLGGLTGILPTGILSELGGILPTGLLGGLGGILKREDLPLPTGLPISLPSISIPSIPTALPISIPDLPTALPISIPDLPTGLPSLSLPSLSLPALPTLSLPVLPTLSLPAIPTLSLPAIPTLSLPALPTALPIPL